MSESAATVVATIGKNNREEIRVSLDQFNGHDLISLRVFTDNSKVEHRLPTKAGIAMKVTKLPALIDGLQKALAEARRRGLVE